jgi:hypothetical protein
MGRTSILFGESSFVLRTVPPITYVIIGNKCPTFLEKENNSFSDYLILHFSCIIITQA